MSGWWGGGVAGGLGKGERERKKKEGRPGRKKGGVWVFPLFSASSGRTKAASLNTGTKSKLDPVRRGGGVVYVVENVALKKGGEVVVKALKKKERSQGSIGICSILSLHGCELPLRPPFSEVKGQDGEGG